MASIAFLIGGAILNATAFIGGSAIANAIKGDTSDEAEAELERHNKAMEKYKKDYNDYVEKRRKLMDVMINNKTQLVMRINI